MNQDHLAVGILAHVDAGKTTLAESILYVSGNIRKLGRVDHKDAFLDNYELERSRGITIFSKQAISPSPCWTLRVMWTFQPKWSEAYRCWITRF